MLKTCNMELEDVGTVARIVGSDRSTLLAKIGLWLLTDVGEVSGRGKGIVPSDECHLNMP